MMAQELGSLPEGWLLTDLDNILLSIMGGGTPGKSNPSYFQGNIPWMSVKDMNRIILDDTVDHISQEAVENSSTNIIPAGTPIIATRMSLGKIVVANFDSAINQDLKALFLPEGLNRSFLVYWYHSKAQYIASLGTGTTVKGIRLEVLRGLAIYLPSLAEQKVIADKLDSLLVQVDSIKTHLDQIPQTLKRFRQAVLSAAVTGKLTEEWRTNGNYEPWVTKRLSYLCSSISDGDHQAPPKSTSGIPFLVISDISCGFINLKKTSRCVPDDYYCSLKSVRKPRKGDILYTVTGSFGIPVIVDSDDPFCFQRHIAIIKPDHTRVDMSYLYYFLQSPVALSRAELVATGTAQKTVSLTSLRQFDVATPPLEEQKEIVARVEKLFTWADNIEKQVAEAQKRVNNLTQSILAKAFRGELTEQWRKENPDLISGENSAAALLEKIKAERALQTKKGKKKA